MTNYIVLFIVLVVVVYLYTWWERRKPYSRQMMDRQEPRKYWAQAAMALYQGDQGGDPGYWKPSKAQKLMANGWSTPDREALISLIERYVEGECNVAFDKLRIIWLARLGFGAKWLDEGSSWQYVLNAVDELRSSYDSWESLYAACLKGREKWNGGELTERQVNWSNDNYAFASKTLLPNISF